MAAETNTILKADVARVRAIDFNYQFTGSLRKMIEALGVTRKIAVQEGTTLKALKVTGTLQSGTVTDPPEPLRDRGNPRGRSGAQQVAQGHHRRSHPQGRL